MLEKVSGPYQSNGIEMIFKSMSKMKIIVQILHSKTLTTFTIAVVDGGLLLVIFKLTLSVILVEGIRKSNRAKGFGD